MTGLTIDPTAVSAAPPLPSLRQELRIEPGAPLVNGAPSWTLFDPVRHAFYQLGQIEFRIFNHWAKGSFDGVAQQLMDVGVAEDDVDATVASVIDFSLANQLTITPMGDSVAHFADIRDRQKKAWWKWMVDNYLFFRVPLVRPAAWLERTLPRVEAVYSMKALWLFVGLALFGFYLVSRQWDAFMASFLYFFSWQGLIAYGFGLMAVKVAHELGHAYTATRYGCRVPSMGVSFLIMFPVLYTDTTAAWRLRSRKQRLAIDCAGVTAELMVATVSTLIWVMLPEGSVRSVFFVLATSSWIMSLAINLNPFMRFDGYYVLSDLFDVPNLQPRAFALGRWRLREMLFALGDAPPEQVPATLRRGMIAYAWMTWVYRLVLFIGIALLVYHMFFKALGIILFVVEMTVFVARPIAQELSVWKARSADIFATRRGKLWPFAIMGLFVLAILPLDRSVSAPAILAPMTTAPVVAGDPARIDRVLVKPGQAVKAGDVLFELSAPELAAGQAERSARIAQLEARLARGTSDDQDLADNGILQRELASERAAVQGLTLRQDRLVLRAPVDGIVTDLTPDVHPGRWVNGAEALALIVTPGRYDIQAYVDEGDIVRITPETEAKFFPDDLGQAPSLAKTVERSGAALQYLDQPQLASLHGGPIAVNEDSQKKLKPREALYRVRLLVALNPVQNNSVIQPQTGVVQIKAPGVSLAQWLFVRASQIWRQEASPR
jgi:putative peptide zinc metalloprotease protein